VLKQQKEITMKISKQQKAAFQSYLRSCLGAVLAVVATGNYMPEDLLKAVLAAALPPLIRWANPKDPAFGRKTQK
jgi:hypothetical protein